MIGIDAPAVAHVRREKVRWLWSGRIPRGKVTILEGDPGLGKSTMMADLSARITTASPLPDGSQPEWPLDVILLSAEDDIADTIRPRAEAAGADLNRLHVLRGVRDNERSDFRPAQLPSDLKRLESLIAETDAALVLVDPLMAYLDAGIDSHRDQDVRRAMHSMSDLAMRTGVALVCLRHLNKNGGGNPLYRGGGSIGIIGAARSGMLVAPDPRDDQRRILAMTKSNLAAMPPALAYRLVNDEEFEVGRVVWEGATEHSAADLLAPPESDEEKGALGEAIEFLRDLLSNGSVASSDVQRQADEAGISGRTLTRARKVLHVRRFKEGTRWFLELKDAKSAKSANISTLENMAALEDGQPPQLGNLGDVGHVGRDDVVVVNP